jgi:predicted DNA-binding transcriptional regulator AlpA
MSARPLLNRKRLADLLQVSRTTLWRLEQDETFPRPVALRPGCERFDPEAIDAWLLQRQIADQIERFNADGTR